MVQPEVVAEVEAEVLESLMPGVAEAEMLESLLSGMVEAEMLESLLLGVAEAEMLESLLLGMVEAEVLVSTARAPNPVIAGQLAEQQEQEERDVESLLGADQNLRTLQATVDRPQLLLGAATF